VIYGRRAGLFNAKPVKVVVEEEEEEEEEEQDDEQAKEEQEEEEEDDSKAKTVNEVDAERHRATPGGGGKQTV